MTLAIVGVSERRDIDNLDQASLYLVVRSLETGKEVGLPVSPEDVSLIVDLARGNGGQVEVAPPPQHEAPQVAMPEFEQSEEFLGMDLDPEPSSDIGEVSDLEDDQL